jgi:hypothetical protein
LLAFVAAPIAGRLDTRAGAGPARRRDGLVGIALLLMDGATPSSHWTTLLPGFIVGGVGIGLRTHRVNGGA